MAAGAFSAMSRNFDFCGFGAAEFTRAVRGRLAAGLIRQLQPLSVEDPEHLRQVVAAL
jgi:hypothetical protein